MKSKGVYSQPDGRKSTQEAVAKRHKEAIAKVKGIDPSEILTLTEVAKILGVSRNTANKYKREGRFSKIGAGRNYSYYLRNEVLSSMGVL